MNVHDRRPGALPVVVAVIGGCAGVASGYVARWTGSPALDGALTILGAGAAVLVLVALAARWSGADVRPLFAGIEVLLDTGLVWVACYAAYRLRFGNGDTLRENFPSFLRSYPLIVAIQMAALLLTGGYGSRIRGTGRELVGVGVAAAAQQLLLQFAILAFWNQTRNYSRGAFLIGGVGAFGLLAGWRSIRWLTAVAPVWWQRIRAHRRPVLALAAGCALTGIVWGAVVPPYEAPDEIYFCRIAAGVADNGKPPPYDPMFFRLVQPLLEMSFNAGLTFEAARNPAFRFVSNEPGRVTMFQQGPRANIRPRELAALYLMRGFALGLAIATTMLIYVSSLAFFGRADLAMLVAGLSFLVPQFTFAGASVNPESLSTLLGAAAAALVVGRATRTLSSGVAWVLLIPLLATAPFTDSAALFLVPFAPIAMALVEHGWKRRLSLLLGVAALGFATIGVGHAFVAELPEAVPAKARAMLAGADLGALSSLGHPFEPFFRQADSPRFLLYEFAPKMFFGFWGWLGQPSILLPPAFYAAVFMLIVASLIGLALLGYSRIRRRGTLDDREPPAFLVAAGIGVLFMLLPIAYSTVLWNRDEWYGRWLFPWLGPIMILVTVGIRELWRVAARRPHVLSASLAIGFVVVLAAWLDGPGSEITAGVRANHYGDQDHLLRTMRYSIIGLGLLPVLVEFIAFVRNRRIELSSPGRSDVRPPPSIVVLFSAWTVNLAILLVFVRPLYRPLDGPGYARAIRAELAQRDVTRAIAIADVALREFPDSDDLARVAPDVVDAIVASGRYDALAAYLESRMTARGMVLTANQTLALARAVRASSGTTRERLVSIAGTLVGNADTVELQILALELMPESAIAQRTMPTAIRERAKTIGLDSHGVRLESFSTRSLPGGDKEVTLYFRPLAEWRGRRIWFHAYPAGSQSYVDVKAAPAAFDGWRPGELAWEVFRTPGPGRFSVYVGIGMGDDLGRAFPIGPIWD